MKQIPEKNKRIAKLIICLCVLFVLLEGSLILHEIGHMISCKAAGQTPQWINIQQSVCNGDLSSDVETIVKFSGGMFSAFVLSILALFLNKIIQLKAYKKCFNTLFLTFIVIQLLNAMMEVSLSTQSYQAIARNLYILLPLVVTILIAAYLIFNRKDIPETQTSYPFCKKMSIRVLHIPLYLILSRAVAWLAEEIQ